MSDHTIPPEKQIRWRQSKLELSKRMEQQDEEEEEKGSNRRNAGSAQDGSGGGSLLIFRKGENRKRAETANVAQDKVLSASVQESEDEAFSSSTSDLSETENRRARKKQQKEPSNALEARHDDKGKEKDSESPWQDQGCEFGFADLSSSSQTTRDKSPKKTGNEARKYRPTTNIAKHKGAQPRPTTKVPETKAARRKTSWVHALIKKKRNGRRVCRCGASFSPKTGLSSIKYHTENVFRLRVHSNEGVFDKDKANLILCRLIAEDCLSLQVADSQNLRDYVSYLRPGYKPPGRKMLTERVLPEVKGSVEGVMHNKLNSIDHVSLSLDGWTSAASRNYIAILCHGITASWALETFLLKVVSVTESETAEYIADVTKSALKEWDIPLANVVAIASDGAANMKRSVKVELQRPWVYCLTHAINRSVFKALEREPIKGIMDKAKAMCKLFRYSQAKRALRKKQKALGLRAVNMKMCCPTRWGSVHKMLKRMVASRQAIVACLAAQRVQTLNDDEWDIIIELVAVLRHLNEASQQLSYQKVPTVGLIVPIFASLLVDHLGDGGDADDGSGDESQAGSQMPIHYDVLEFKRFLSDDLSKRWDVIQESAPSELLMSAYLDPRTKDFSFVDDGDKRQQCLERVRATAARLLVETRAESSTPRQTSDTTDSTVGRKKVKGKGKEKCDEEERRKEKEAAASRKRDARKERMIRVYGK